MSSAKEFVTQAKPHIFNLIAGSIDESGVITGIDELDAPPDLKTTAGLAENIAALPDAPRAGQIRIGVHFVDHTSPAEIPGELILWGFQPMTFRLNGAVTPVKIGGTVAGQWQPLGSLKNYDADILNMKFPVVDAINLWAEISHLRLEFTGTLGADVYAWWAFVEGML